ncbi:biosynthetic arginine decarboxylase [Sediminicurvatus halobius]|uniref:Arginine decarboxylase n=1 Tax=Sediminicurvatus halobius TaxID=2182432 RepID=A0A2U2N6W5_9GAMM|nr:biosynthetic arginine decarboxylase [Spiribacter halobius]PWG64860.1 arginine decarboxylase [Spiribacter halobius]UEX78286.1 biosynthetic arginine decarboxylase [Spiribacter halobius]
MEDLPAVAYNLAQWSGGYFRADDRGRLLAVPDRGAGGPAVVLEEVVAEARAAGLALPLLVRFADILQDRVRHLCAAFDAACAAEDFQGGYTAVYPIKVNQQRRVVEAILAGAPGRVGLEAGSKPELMAVLAAAPPGSRVICNGYKDREYVRLALRARQLGLDARLVVEKRSELAVIIDEAARLGLRPNLGLRVRLASLGEGKWQNTGGEKSKFGLSATDALAVVERLRAAGLLECLDLLHFHLGSQIANIADIQRGMREAIRYYVELHRLGAPVTVVDVGGGLGVDYEGTRSRSHCSMNYSLEEYAHNVVHTVREICSEHDLPQPHLVTEAGRAMTAHHAVLVTDVIDVESVADGPPPTEPPGEEAPLVLRDLWRGYASAAERSPLEVCHDAAHWLAEARSQYQHGVLGLAGRAEAERLYHATCLAVRRRLDPRIRAHRELLDELDEKLADKVFVNLSLFQSMPDIWAIDQIFPILPLHRLDEPPQRRAVLQDLTCDSDGAIHQYVARDGVETTLPLPGPGAPLLLGAFLVGAYQEILGDMHNLFGDTDSVNVSLTADGWRLDDPHNGDSIESVLAHVRFGERELLQAYRRRVAASGLPAAARTECLRELEAGLQGSTYLRTEEGE